jgi:hypothetical protein
MEKKIEMPNADNKFRLVQERLEIDEVVIEENVIVANHTLIELRNTPTFYITEAIEIAADQCNLNIDISDNLISFQDGHLTKAIEFIEHSVLQN